MRSPSVELVPFIDLAYQGFAVGLEPDAWGGASFRRAHPQLLRRHFVHELRSVRRAGGRAVHRPRRRRPANRVRSQIKIVIRNELLQPPTHQAQLVATVLADAELRSVWEEELSGMRLRIQQVRGQLVEYLRVAGVDDMGFIAEQRGMFSYSGLTKDQPGIARGVAVDGTDAGRICVAAVNSGSVEYVANAIAAVR